MTAPITLVRLPRTRRGRALRALRQAALLAFLTAAFCALAGFAAGVIVALFPNPF